VNPLFHDINTSDISARTATVGRYHICHVPTTDGLPMRND
jgi:hypothetical protein